MSTWLSKNCATYIVCRELAATNPHLHIYGDTELQYKGLQTSFRRAFPLHIGNESYSLKKCDGNYDDYLKYICKGDSKLEQPDIICRQGIDFTDAWIVQQHASYWVTNDDLMKNAKKRDNLKFRGTVVEQLEQACKEAKLDGHDRTAIAKLYVQKYVDARKPVNVFHAKGVVNTVCAILSQFEFDQLVDACASRPGQ